MKKSNLEMEFEELSNQFNCDINTIKSIYFELKNKKCTDNGDLNQLLDCLYSTLLERKIRENRRNNSNERIKYTSTDDYAINKSLFDTYGDLALNELSDSFIYYMISKDNLFVDSYQIKSF